jgi:hypothetical protein
VGAASGSGLYYACDAYMLRDFGRAKKRAAEVRDELIGVVATQLPVNEVKDRLNTRVVSPLSEAKEKAKQTWNTGISTVLSTVSDNLSPAVSVPAMFSSNPPPPSTPLEAADVDVFPEMVAAEKESKKTSS